MKFDYIKIAAVAGVAVFGSLSKPVDAQFGLPNIPGVGDVVECFDSDLLDVAQTCVTGVVGRLGLSLFNVFAFQGLNPLFAEDRAELREELCDVVRIHYQYIIQCALICEAAEDIFCAAQAFGFFEVIRDDYEENSCSFDAEEICDSFVSELQLQVEAQPSAASSVSPKAIAALPALAIATRQLLL